MLQIVQRELFLGIIQSTLKNNMQTDSLQASQLVVKHGIFKEAYELDDDLLLQMDGQLSILSHSRYVVHSSESGSWHWHILPPRPPPPCAELTAATGGGPGNCVEVSSLVSSHTPVPTPNFPANMTHECGS